MEKISRKIFNYESVILETETYNEFEYNSKDLSEKSFKYVIATCRFCGKPHKIKYRIFLKSGSACHRECSIEEQKINSPFKDKNTRKKALEKIKDKYGSVYASQNNEIAKK